MRVHIWFPLDAHRRLLEGLPRWSPAHGPLTDATEVESAVGMRRVGCGLSEAAALLQFAERCYPEAAPLIRNAIRRAGSAAPARRHTVAPPRTHPRLRAPDRRRQRPGLHRLATFHLVVFAFQLLHALDRSRGILRRLLSSAATAG